MLCTFLYNEWKTDYCRIGEGTSFSAYSAGIFNVLLASGSVEFSPLVRFIRKRAQLIQDMNISERLWMVISRGLLSKIEYIKAEFKDAVDCAITVDENSAVLAMSSGTKKLLESWFELNGSAIKVVDLNVNAPYHTKFLDSKKLEYIELISRLNITQNTNYRYIFDNTNLKQEVIDQWSSTFNWYGLKKRIVNLDKSIVDISPNRFITKQLRRTLRQQGEMR